MRKSAEPPARRDRLVGFALSGAFHVAALSVGGWTLFQPARYGVEAGSGGLAIYLVAAPPAGVSAEAVGEAPSGEKVLPRLTPAAPSGARATFYSPGGGESNAEPGPLRNPAPPYPPAARRLGQEGVVLLRIAIDNVGLPTRVEVQRSSGFPLLDESALKTVCCWKFLPARTAGVARASVASLRVNFVLKEKEE